MQNCVVSFFHFWEKLNSELFALPVLKYIFIIDKDTVVAGQILKKYICNKKIQIWKVANQHLFETDFFNEDLIISERVLCIQKCFIKQHFQYWLILTNHFKVYFNGLFLMGGFLK